DLDQACARHASLHRYACKQCRTRLAESFHAVVLRMAADLDLFDLADLSIGDLQSQRQGAASTGRIGALFDEGGQDRDLLRGHVGDEQTELALALDAAPEAVTDRQLLPVRREAYVRGKSCGPGVARDRGVEIGIDPTLQAGAVAGWLRPERWQGNDAQADHVDDLADADHSASLRK